MKLFILLLLLSLIIVSCSPFLINTKNYESPKLTLAEAWLKTASYKYISDNNEWTDIKSPIQFEEDGGGDCEDFSGYLMYQLGYGAHIHVFDLDVNKGHSIVKINDYYIEPIYFGRVIDLKEENYIILFEYTYEETMAFITLFGTKGI